MALYFDRLTIPPAGSLNNAASNAGKRQLAAAGSRAAVPLVYGQDRIGALILNVLPSTTAGQVLVQCLWCFACDDISDVRLNDLALPAGASAMHYTGAQTSFDAPLAAAFAAQGISYTISLNGFAYSVLSLPSASFDGQLSITALVRGRKLYDRRKDSTAGGSGTHLLASPATWEWSDNPALALADFCSNATYGAGTAVDWSTVPAAANACDALVGAPAEKRRVMGLALTSASPVEDVAESLRAYAGCFLLPGVNGVRLLPDQADTAVASYSHAAGEIAAIAALDFRDLGQVPTAVEVLYTDTRVIPWREATAIASVSGAGTTRPWRLSQVRLPGIQRYSQAVREATERINKLLLQDLTTTLDVFDGGIKHDVGDIITVAHPVGLSATPMRIAALSMPSAGRWRFGLVRHDPAAYSDTVASPPSLGDTQRVISLSAAAISKTLTIRLNADTFSGPTNYNEAYIHGIDNGAPVDAPGQILVNGVATAAPNSPVFTNRGPVAGFVVWARDTGFSTTQGTRPYVMARKAAAGWEYDDNSSGWVPFTPDAQHVIIGTIETGAADSNSPPGITAASIWAAATTLDALGSLSDAGFAAQTAASAAAASASSALSTLATMRSNGFLDAAEKPAVIREWQRISGERAGIVAQANVYGIVAERDAYTSAHDALNAYLSGLSPAYNDTSTDTPITPAVDQAAWAALYLSRQTLLNRITDEISRRGQRNAGDNLIPDPQFLSASYWLGGWDVAPVASFAPVNAVRWEGNYAGSPGVALQFNAGAPLGDQTGGRILVERLGVYRLKMRVFKADAAGLMWAGLHVPGQVWWTAPPVNGGLQPSNSTPELGWNLGAIANGVWTDFETQVQIVGADALQVQPRLRNALTAGTVYVTMELTRVANWSNQITGPGKPQDNATLGAPAGTYVGSIPAEAVESISGAQAKADAAAAAAQSAAQAYAAAQANAANVSARAYADGIVTAEEARAIADAAAKAEAARVAAVSAAAADATAKADVAATTALWSGVSGVNVTTGQIAPDAATVVLASFLAGPVSQFNDL